MCNTAMFYDYVLYLCVAFYICNFYISRSAFYEVKGFYVFYVPYSRFLRNTKLFIALLAACTACMCFKLSLYILEKSFSR